MIQPALLCFIIITLKGLTESPLMTLDDSILMSEISDAIREQVGVKYAEDLI